MRFVGKKKNKVILFIDWDVMIVSDTAGKIKESNFNKVIQCFFPAEVLLVSVMKL